MEKQITYKRYHDIYSISVDGVKSDFYIEKFCGNGTYYLYKGYKHAVALKGGFGHLGCRYLRDMQHYVREIRYFLNSGVGKRGGRVWWVQKKLIVSRQPISINLKSNTMKNTVQI